MDPWATVSMDLGHRSIIKGRFLGKNTAGLVTVAAGNFVLMCERCGHIGGCHTPCACIGISRSKCQENCMLRVIGFVLDEPNLQSLARSVLLQGIIPFESSDFDLGEVVRVNKYGIITPGSDYPAALALGTIAGLVQLLLLT